MQKVGNLDTDPAPETAFFHYDTTASSDLDLLTHGLDGTVDPPVQVQRDLLGRIIFDGVYFYGYDAWGRLTQINLAEFDTNGDPQQGELVRHFVYDGLGRTIRVQRAADSGFINDPGVSYVSSEFIFYDGMRRIADVLAAPVYDKYSALVTGGESGQNQNEAGQEAGHFVDGKTANTGFEHLELGGDTYLQVHREYVWDPDPDYSPFGGVDTLVAYFEGADRDKAWHVIQNQQGDPVAIVEGDAEQDATIVWRAAFEPYGSVVWSSNATPDPFPRLAMGHKALFVERLDAPPVVWFFNDDERLAPEADLLVLMRNRQYLPRLGRFLQPDPNATGVAVQPSLAYGGSALPTPDPYVDLHTWAADGTSALAYAMSDPVNGADPTGLFWGGLAGLAFEGLQLYAGYADTLGEVHQGIRRFMNVYDMIELHTLNQEFDLDWALHWDLPDSDYSSGLDQGNDLGSASYDMTDEGPVLAASRSTYTPTKRSNLRGVSRTVYQARSRQYDRMYPSLWKKEARRNAHLYSQSQLVQMNAGRSPIGSDGKRMIIHHNRPLKYGGRNNWGNFSFVTYTEHTKNFGRIHRYRAPKLWAPPFPRLPRPR